MNTLSATYELGLGEPFIEILAHRFQMENHSQPSQQLQPQDLPCVMLFGIGNPYRRDDGIGHMLAEHLAVLLVERSWQVTLQLVHQLTPDIAEVIADVNPDAVIFADVDATGAPPALSIITPGAPQDAASHASSPGFILLLAQQLYACYSPGFLATVPGFDFDHGEGISLLAQQSLGQTPELVDNFLASQLPHK